MKKMLMVWMAVATLGATASAQKNQENVTPNGARKNVHHQAALEKLNLSNAQQDQLKKLRADYQTQMKELRQNESITVKEQRDFSEALRKNHRGQMESLLTTEQKRTLNDQKKLNRQQASRRSKEQWQKMQHELNLTPDQAKALASSRQQTREKMKAIRENDQLDRSARNTEMKAVRQEAKLGIENVLTQTQRTQWKQMRQQRSATCKSNMRARRGHAIK